MMKTYVVFSITCLLFLGCEPITVIGGGATVGTMATREKGITGAVGDSRISLEINSKFYQYDTLRGRVGVNVQNGEVLLTGKVDQPEWVAEAEKMVWTVNGVENVINHIEVSEDVTLGRSASDSLITSQVKTHLFFDGSIRSLNYSIKTVDGVVYIMGTAQSEEELKKVAHYAQTTKGVKKVVCCAYVKETLHSASDLSALPEGSDSALPEGS